MDSDETLIITHEDLARRVPEGRYALIPIAAFNRASARARAADLVVFYWRKVIRGWERGSLGAAAIRRSIPDGLIDRLNTLLGAYDA